MRKLKGENDLKLEVAEFSKMSQPGSSLLRSLQNNDLPILDLFTRESIQNSLDASSQDNNSDHIAVDIGIKSLNLEEFVNHFEGVEDKILERFTNHPNKSLYIRDRNTSGLTGELDYRNGLEKAGNIYKLIYGISHPQTKEGAGGSWGLGKTIYFRLGIGLVIYYSRVKLSDNSFQERLAATLVEDEESVASILPKEKGWNRGIAWWGQAIEPGSSNTCPITNSEDIRDILSALNIKPYEDNDTGTTVIIPFVNEKMSQISTNENPPWWESNIESYLKIAVQRWYAPRLDNPTYQYGKWLRLKINGQEIKRETFEPVFKEIQYLYNQASQTISSSEKNNLMKKNYYVENIFTKGIVSPSEDGLPNGGRVAFKKFSEDELDMIRPINALNPFEYINKDNNGGELNSPIVTYVRKPGMLINYDVGNEWSGNIEVNNNEFLIAIFVPNSYSKLNSDSVKILEEYLRKSEEADHASWSNLIIDGKRTRLISSLRNSVKKALSNVYSVDEKKQVQSNTTMLAKKFGKLLLPPRGYGKRANGISANSTTGKSTNYNANTGNISFEIINQNYDNEGFIVLDYRLLVSELVKKTKIELFVQSESGLINSNDWEDEDKGIGTEFPVSFKGYNLNKINNNDLIENLDEISLIKVNTSRYQVNSKIIIENLMEADIEGQFKIANRDPLLQFSVLARIEEETI